MDEYLEAIGLTDLEVHEIRLGGWMRLEGCVKLMRLALKDVCASVDVIYIMDTYPRLLVDYLNGKHLEIPLPAGYMYLEQVEGLSEMIRHLPMAG